MLFRKTIALFSSLLLLMTPLAPSYAQDRHEVIGDLDDQGMISEIDNNPSIKVFNSIGEQGKLSKVNFFSTTPTYVVFSDPEVSTKITLSFYYVPELKQIHLLLFLGDDLKAMETSNPIAQRAIDLSVFNFRGDDGEKSAQDKAFDLKVYFEQLKRGLQRDILINTNEHEKNDIKKLENNNGKRNVQTVIHTLVGTGLGLALKYLKAKLADPHLDPAKKSKFGRWRKGLAVAFGVNLLIAGGMQINELVKVIVPELLGDFSLVK